MTDSVLFNVIGISLVVLLGSFAVVLVVDALLVLLAHDYNGVIFNRMKKQDKVAMKQKYAENAKTHKLEDEKQNSFVKEAKIEPTSGMPTITPFLDMQETNEELQEDGIQQVDFNKAVEEQKLLQKSMMQEDEEPSVTKLEQPLFEKNEIKSADTAILDDEDEDDDLEEDDDISEIIKTVQEQAMQEIAKEDANHVTVVEKEILEDDEDEEEEKKPVEKVEEAYLLNKQVDVQNAPKGKIVRPKLILKEIHMDAPQPEKTVETTETVVITEKVEEPKPTKQEQQDINELRKIREDIFNLRVSAFKDLKNNKDGIVSKEKQEEVAKFDEETHIKLEELEGFKQYKQTIETEKDALIKTTQEVTNEKNKLTQEVELLEKELETLKNTVGIVDKPYYSKEYYENRLMDLQAQLKESNKELRLNRREFNPLKRIKRSFDKDIRKLRRKEAQVAKQKLKLYGVNNIEDIDPDKKKELDEDVIILTNLKDSVRYSEVILEQNKDRYPILERTNNLLTKHVKSLKAEIENVQKAINYYTALEETEDDANGDAE